MWKLTRLTSSRNYFSTQPNYFKLFGLPYDFTEQQLKASYLQLVKKHHPDLTQDPSSQQIFKLVQVGYEVLSDQVKRKQHQSQQKQTTDQTDQQTQSIVDEIRDRFFKNFERKDQVNDQYNFTYKMFKQHYQKVQAPKAQYQRYQGQGRDEYYAKKDQKGEQVWKHVAAGVSALAAIAIAFAYTHS